MKKVLILNIFFFIALNAYTQHILSGNLVPNPGFENYTTCPDNFGQIYYAYPWSDCLNVPPWGSTDFLHNCSVNSQIITILQFKQPKSGNGCAGITLYMAPDIYDYYHYREYIEVQLINKLGKNNKYCINYHVIFSTISQIAVKNIDLFFSNNYIRYDSTIIPFVSLIDTIPQIRNNKGIITDTVNWTKISGAYEAFGGEEYITIGNFNDDFNTNLQNIKSNPFFSYYLIDDVSVCECSFDINLGADTSLCEGESIILNPNLPNATYTWQDSSHTATYEVKQPGTYWVRAYVADYDVYSSDTIVITQGDDNFCNPPLTIPNVITPNGDGANDNFVIQNAESYTITLQIYNRWGRLIYENTNYQNDFSCKTCAAGVYYYVLKAKSKRNGREKEYKGSLTIVNG
jgi:gliding motility-associated-like protein